ncbi:N-acetylmannosaminyltransferase [Bryocella elongata]|uniref:N-acetylmannosaminyltransferase n=1 Tax=Bryocella elongata TaxID=863522 RepID=A0A1H6AUV8_9BACT|nr:WecB/TagA/CpsF family glycosyltransferase [Bryocella elongata]SEG52428.1 N-acetylmannosaminyltransferase [Bryocella elongata]
MSLLASWTYPRESAGVLEGPAGARTIPRRPSFADTAHITSIAPDVRTVALFGLPIANVSMDEAVAHIEHAIEARRFEQIATANLDFARNARVDANLHRVICDCTMVVPDGAPMLWAAKLFNRPLKQRVTGVDLVPRLAKLSADKGYGIYLLGSTESRADRAVQVLEGRFPGLHIAGRYAPPPCPLDEMDDDAILERIHTAKTRILLVAFGNPKQELWIARNRDRLEGIVAIGIGGSLDMIAGSLRRAPGIIQAMQLEWLFRMAQEPRRLLPRYARDFRALMHHLPTELSASRRQGSQAKLWPMEVTSDEKTRILRVPEILTGSDCYAVVREASSAARRGQMLIFDLVLTGRIEADGLGSLLEARRIMSAAKLPVWTVGINEPVRRLVESAGLTEMVRFVRNVPEAVRLAGRPTSDRRRNTQPYAGQERRDSRRQRRAPRA